MDTLEEYICKRCNQSYPLTIEFFPKEKNKISGLSCNCRPCSAIMRKETRQRKLALRRPCTVEGCERFIVKGSMCNKHTLQIARHNKIFERTRFDPNVIEEQGLISYLHIHDDAGSGELLGKVILDTSDVSKIKGFKWTFHDGSIKTKSGKSTNIREYILPCPQSKWTQNRDGNCWDCRKSNLVVRNRAEANRFNKVSIDILPHLKEGDSW